MSAASSGKEWFLRTELAKLLGISERTLKRDEDRDPEHFPKPIVVGRLDSDRQRRKYNRSEIIRYYRQRGGQ